MFRLPPIIDAPFVIGEMNFSAPKFRGARVPWVEKDAIEEIRSMFVRQQFRVYDARALQRPPHLKTEGFQLLDAPAPDLGLDAGESAIRRFYGQCSELVAEATGCDAAWAVQHEFRIGAPIPGGAGKGIYANCAHTDLCPPFEDTVSSPSGRHFAVYNVWRSIDPQRSIESFPLTVCDAHSVEEADLVYANSKRLTEPETQLIYCRLIHNQQQCWHYFPQMTHQEALIFRLYDTREENPCRRATFHGAFTDPTSPTDAPLRRSIEVRVVAVFPEADTDRESRKARFRRQVPDTCLDGSPAEWTYEKMVDWNYDEGNAAAKDNG